MNKNILIYCFQSYGHRVEFIEYILEYLGSYSSKESFKILIPSKTVELLAKDIVIPKCVSIHEIPKEYEDQVAKEKSSLNKSKIKYRMLQKIVALLKIDKVIFLEIDNYQFVLGKSQLSTTKKVDIEGIFMQPYTQEPNSKVLKRVRKRMQLVWMHRNKNIKKLYLLNDAKSTDELNDKIGIDNIYTYLPDPIRKRKVEYKDIRGSYDITNDKKVYSIVGAINGRKNIDAIINCLSMLSDDQKESICLIIAGRCTDEKLDNRILDFMKAESKIQVIYENAFIDNSLFENFVSQSDFIFVLYQDFYSSSGIVGNAAKHGKTILGCKIGVIGHLVESHNLGLTANPNDFNDIKEMINNSFKIDPKIDQTNNDFLKSHNFLEFTKILLGHDSL